MVVGLEVVGLEVVGLGGCMGKFGGKWRKMGRNSGILWEI